MPPLRPRPLARLVLPLVPVLGGLGALLGGCSDSGAAPPSGGTVEDLRQAAQTLAARPEHTASVVEVQHILIAHAGADVPGATRTLEEAEERAAEVLGRIENGEDFGTLVEQFSDDPGRPGIYTMVADLSLKASNPGSMGRQEMVRAFGDVGWRLEVGKVGVAPHDPAASPYGWHLVKRLR